MAIRTTIRYMCSKIRSRTPAKVEDMAKAYEAWAKRCMVEPYPGQFKKKRQ